MWWANEMSNPGFDASMQELLTDYETRRLPIGNQFTDDPSIIEWQVVKGAALYYGVVDWLSVADTTLTYEENVSLMRRYATRNGGPTMRELGKPAYMYE